MTGGPFGASLVPEWNRSEMGVSLEVPVILVDFIERR